MQLHARSGASRSAAAAQERRGAVFSSSAALRTCAQVRQQHSKLPSGRRCSLLGRAALVPEAAQQEAAPEATTKVSWWNKGNPKNMKNVSNIQELVDQLADAGDKLVVMEVYAPWCAACKAVFPKICQIVGEHVDDVVFLKVSYEDNKDMCRTLGVKVLPYFHMYKGALGKVAAFSCTVSKIQRFRDMLDEHLGAICSLEEPEALVEEFPEVHPHHPLILDVHDDDMYDHPPGLAVPSSPDTPTRLPA